MCKTKMATDAVPPISPSRRHRKTTHHHQPPPSSSLDPSTTTTSVTPTTTATNATAFTSSSSSSISSRNSLSSIRSSLPDNPHLYDISEIRSATNNFLSKNTSSKTNSSTRSWRCNLHNKDVIIFQRKSHHKNHPSTIRQKLSSICRSHHVAVVNLLGACLSGDDYIYLVYEFINGASLSDLLHNRNNPDFTALNTWMSRMQIASDIASAIDYIHNSTGLEVKFVHNHIKASSVIVTEPNFHAKISHYGTAELCGEPVEEREKFSSKIDEEEEEILPEEVDTPRLLTRSNSVKFSGTRGYMSPEFQITGVGTRKSDVYAYGVVLIELLSGEEPMRYKFDKKTKEYLKISAIDAAREVVADGGEGRLRKWIDRRLKDSFPVEVAEKMTRLALDCVHVDPDQRPDMRHVAGKISRLYLQSEAWCEKMRIPTEITVSFAPR